VTIDPPTSRDLKGPVAELVAGIANFNVPHSNIYELQVNTEYRYYDLYCASSLIVPYQWKSAQIWELRPYDWTGGSRKVNSTAYTCPNSQFKQELGAGDDLWVSKTSTYGRTNSISFGGFSLNSSQKDTTTHKKTFSNSSSTSANICGQDNQPLLSDKVSED
jgi:hypothetical protein